MPSLPRHQRRRLLAWTSRIPAAPYVAAVLLLMAGTWGIVAGAGQALTVWNHVFYLPIVLAALRFGAAAGAGAGLLAGVLAGPLSGHLAPAVTLPRAALFAVVGAVVGALAMAQADALRRERDIAARESALVAQRASLVQLVSHEFRTPLTIIRGTLETLAERRGAVAVPFQDLLEASERSVGRLQEMVDVVLAAADELDTGTTPQVAVDVAALVQHAAVSLRRDLPDRLRVEVPTGATIVTVEPYLWLAVRCLLDNAAKFSPVDEPILVGFRVEAACVELSVADAGPGLPPGFEEAAFEPFTQADTSSTRPHPGLGIGLYTARRLVRRLGGDVTVVSAPGRGAVASIRLPQRRRADHDAVPRPDHAPEWPSDTVPTRGRRPSG